MIKEVSVYCPKCKTLETIWLNQGWLVKTRHFTMDIHRMLYHCSPQPCRMFLNGAIYTNQHKYSAEERCVVQDADVRNLLRQSGLTNRIL